MINVTLRQLRYFDALARHGHFGRAADACSVSQPALSMQIKEMEQALGGALLDRSARQVALTQFGEELLQRVRTSCARSTSSAISPAPRRTASRGGCGSA
jgi:LysR family transcriptional regulator, hydrogen peroxide-inducible genes activator